MSIVKRAAKTLGLAAIFLTGGFLLSSIVYDVRSGPSVLDMYETLAPSMAILSAPNRGYGSAFAVLARSGQKVLITNAHVCALSPNGKINVSMPLIDAAPITVGGTILRVSMEHDLCAVFVAGNYLSPLVLAEDYSVQRVFAAGFPTLPLLSMREGQIIGQSVLAVPMPLPLLWCDSPSRQVAIDPQNLAAEPQCLVHNEFLITTLQVAQGGSGSPVLDEDARVVGVISISMANATMSGAVPLEALAQFLKGL